MYDIYVYIFTDRITRAVNQLHTILAYTELPHQYCSAADKQGPGAPSAIHCPSLAFYSRRFQCLEMVHFIQK